MKSACSPRIGSTHRLRREVRRVDAPMTIKLFPNTTIGDHIMELEKRRSGLPILDSFGQQCSKIPLILTDLADLSLFQLHPVFPGNVV